MAKKVNTFSVKNKQVVLNALELRIQRMNKVPDEVYRDIIRKVFLRVLRQTPQFSGKAVASWVIGVGAPGSVDSENLGDEGLQLARAMGGGARPRQRGDRRWRDVAWSREKGKIDRIKYGQAVYITNSALGDTDNGKSLESYITSLQDPAYAAEKLRPLHQPYEIVAESVAYVAARYRNRKIPLFAASLALPAGGEE